MTIQIKNYEANSMQDVMHLIRVEMGDDAVILSSNKTSDGKITVTVAKEQNVGKDDLSEEYFNDIDWTDSIDEYTTKNTEKLVKELIYNNGLNANGLNNAPIANIRTPAPIPALMPDYILREIEQILISHGVIDDICDNLLNIASNFPYLGHENPDIIQDILISILEQGLNFSPINFKNKHIMLVGVPGAGKTLTVAKIASRMVKSCKLVKIINTDLKKAGAIEQLSAFANILNIELVSSATKEDIKNVLTNYNGNIIIDSAGVNPYSFSEVKELAEFAKIADIEPVLVFPSGLDPMEASEIANAFSFLGVERMIITRTDVARRFGSILTAAGASGIAISHITGTDKVLGEFNNASPEILANMLLKSK